MVKLRSSRGLTMKRQAKEEEEEEKMVPLEREVEIQLPEVPPFSSVSTPLTVLAELGPQRDAATIEHMVRYHRGLKSIQVDYVGHNNVLESVCGRIRLLWQEICYD